MTRAALSVRDGPERSTERSPVLRRPGLTVGIGVSVAVHLLLLTLVIAVSRKREPAAGHAGALSVDNPIGVASGIARRAASTKSRPLTEKEARSCAGIYRLSDGRGVVLTITVEPVNESGPIDDRWALRVIDTVRGTKRLVAESQPGWFTYEFDPALTVRFSEDSSRSPVTLMGHGSNLVGGRVARGPR